MSKSESIDLKSQLAAHMASLRSAGIFFVPRGPNLELPKVEEPGQQQASETGQSARKAEAGSLFAAALPETSGLLPSHLAASPDDRRKALTVLAAEVSKCDLCPELYSTRTQTVFGVGPIDPEVAFVGEAPGGDEDRQGEPFVGRSGQLLTRIIVGCGFARKDVYIINILKCRPPSNRTPNPSECLNCRPFFERQIELIAPKFIVALGAVAAKNLLQTSLGIGKLRGTVHEYRGRPLICTFHPSALLRDESGKMKRDCWEDMKLLLRTMGRPIPQVKRSE